ncbi:MAG: helix-turn-helix domain-containing protein [Candidatus Coatesbacteria bacterium]|nr:helix-turn-helix domain-containing protein [Candidatus Coatesbacteria bacterium]
MANKCSLCENAMEETRGDYPFPESGLPNVVLVYIPLLKCPNCGNVEPMIHRAKHLIRALALIVLSKPHALCGAEIRYLRKHVGWKAVELAQILGVDKTTVSKWENDQDPIGSQSDRLLRVIIRNQIKVKELHEAAVRAEREERFQELIRVIEKDYRDSRLDQLCSILDVRRSSDHACAKFIVEERDGEYYAEIA